MKRYRLEGGGVRYEGQVINLEQDISSVVNVLPSIPSNVPIIIYRRFNSSAHTQFTDFKVRRSVIKQWLQFLKAHSPAYADVVISNENLEQLPENGSIGDMLNCTEIDKDAVINNPVRNLTEQELGPDASIVVFHGDPKPHQISNKLSEYWQTDK